MPPERRCPRRTATWGAVVAVLLHGVLLGALLDAPAQAAPTDVFVELNPSTVQAGFKVGVRASCGEGLNPGTVHSDAFGTVTITPYRGLLTTAIPIRAGTGPGEYPVRLQCANGASAGASLHVIHMATPTRGPATGGGGAAGTDRAPLLLGGGLAALVAGVGLLVARQRRTVPGR